MGVWERGCGERGRGERGSVRAPALRLRRTAEAAYCRQHATDTICPLKNGKLYWSDSLPHSLRQTSSGPMGRSLNVDWQHSKQELRDCYLEETDHRDRTRLQPLLCAKGEQ